MCEKTAAIARDLFSYDAKTGALTWSKTAPNKTAFLGRHAGTVESVGYVYVRLNGKRYAAHRVIWLMVTGSWPKGQIDHINGDKLDNSFANLRDVCPRINAENKHNARSDSRSGAIGVYQQGSRWFAYIYARGKKHSLGGYATLEQASAARAAAKPVFHRESANV